MCAVRNHTAPGALPPGYQLNGRYEVQEEVGRGSMGVVYRARRLEDNLTVAVKVVDQQLRNNQEALARFRREAELGNRIKHPNVVQILDTGETPFGVPYLVEEFLTGKDLQHHLARGEVLSLREITFLIAALCDALEAAHAQAIVHRDLKPGNIVLGRGPRGELTIKLIDFGLAKSLSADPGNMLTAQVSAIGTPAYMSPEQLQNEPLDARSDIYALGVILYQLLCGSLPYWSDNPIDLADKILNEKPVDVRQRAAARRIPASLAKLAMQSLSRTPNQRPKNVAEVRARVLRAREELAGGLSTFRRFLQWVGLS
jgi:serine/threonine-protein kinase